MMAASVFNYPFPKRDELMNLNTINDNKKKVITTNRNPMNLEDIDGATKKSKAN